MRKILSGLTGLLVVTMITAVSAYAVFSSQVTVTGATLGTGTAGLEIAGNFNGTWFPSESDGATTLSLEGKEFINRLYPGQSDWGHFKLFNETNPEADMNISARLTSASGDWNSLKDVMEMRVVVYTGDENAPYGEATEWMTLSEWNANEQTFPGNPLEGGSTEEYLVEVKLPDDAGNAVMNKTISDMQFVITGTAIEQEDTL